MNKQQWQDTILKSYIKRHSPSKSEVTHIMDFLNKNPQVKLSTRVSYLSIKDKAELWVKKLNQHKQELRESGEVEDVVIYSDGMKFVRLVDKASFLWEGKHMGHCVASYAGSENIYSLRDKDNYPHVTIEVDSDYQDVMQISGKGNGYVVRKYHHHVIEFLKLEKLDPDRDVLDDMGLMSLNDLAPSSLMYLKRHFSGIELVKFPCGEFLLDATGAEIKKELKTYDPRVFSLLCSLGGISEGILEAFCVADCDAFSADFIGTIARNNDLELLALAHKLRCNFEAFNGNYDGELDVINSQTWLGLVKAIGVKELYWKQECIYSAICEKNDKLFKLMTPTFKYVDSEYAGGKIMVEALDLAARNENYEYSLKILPHVPKTDLDSYDKKDPEKPFEPTWPSPLEILKAAAVKDGRIDVLNKIKELGY